MWIWVMGLCVTGVYFDVVGISGGMVDCVLGLFCVV